MPRKVFTAGEVLAAADVNEFLGDQAIMTFATSAARGSAIPTPVEGMYTHLEDTDALQFYNGSAFVSPFGMTLVANQSFTSQNTVIFNDIFTSQFDSYQIYTTLTAAGAGHDGNIVLRAATVNAITNYQVAYVQASGGVVNGFSNAAAVNMQIGRFDTAGGVSVMTLHNPAVAERTFGLLTSVDSGMFTRLTSGMHTTAQAYDGLQFNFNSGTGTIRIYGIRKS